MPVGMPPNESVSPVAARKNETNQLDSGPVSLESQPLNVSSPTAEVNTKVKFISGDTVKVDMDSSNTNDVSSPFIPLTKDQLNEYALDPFWVRLRWFLFVFFWIAWLIMLVGAVVIIYLAPKCPKPAPKQWWQKAPIYEVYAKSFMDSNDDGVGDIVGIESKLDHFVDLGIGSLWLTPIFKSPMVDAGYDIQDFKDIDSIFGSMQQFESLVSEMKARNLKLIMDFVPNHSSDQHEWFKKSIKRVKPYDNYYIWKSGNKTQPPNNWKSVFSGSAWEYNDERGEWYLHQFLKEQPDLNLTNPGVIRELLEILEFWLDKGVDGFRVDSVGHFYEDPLFRNEPFLPGMSGKGYENLNHIYTYNQEPTLDLIKSFRQTLDNKTAQDPSNPRIMMTEAYMPLDELIKYYGKTDGAVSDGSNDGTGTLSQMPLNFDLITNLKDTSSATAQNVGGTIKAYLDGLPEGAWPNFNLGNHDNPRVATRVGEDLVDVMNCILLLLPGTPFTYYGEEIGMTDGADNEDPRDPERSPMQWNNSQNAGFTSPGVSPWLAVNSNYRTINVASQKSLKNSHYAIYKALAALRHKESILRGDFASFVNGNVFGYTRICRGSPGYLVIVNFGSKNMEKPIDVLAYLNNLPDYGSVEVVTPSKNSSELAISRVNFNEIHLKAKQALVISFVPQ